MIEFLFIFAVMLGGFIFLAWFAALVKAIRSLSHALYQNAKSIQALNKSASNVEIHVQYPELVMKLVAFEAAEKVKAAQDELERRAGEANKKPVKRAKLH